MSDAILASASRPKLAAAVIIHRGTQALGLAMKHREGIEPRLRKGTLRRLAADLEKLGAVIPGATLAHAEAEAATAALHVELAHGTKLIHALRGAVREAKPASDVRKAYGVGQQVNPLVAKTVTAVLQLIRDRAKANPSEATALGITPKDVVAVEARLAAIRAAFTASHARRTAAPLATKERNRTLNRVLYAIGCISAAGGLEFVEDEERAKLFEELEPRRAPRKARTARGSAGR